MSPYIPEEEGRGEGEEKSALSLRRSVRISLSSPLALSCVSTKKIKKFLPFIRRTLFVDLRGVCVCVCVCVRRKGDEELRKNPSINLLFPLVICLHLSFHPVEVLSIFYFFGFWWEAKNRSCASILYKEVIF